MRRSLKRDIIEKIEQVNDIIRDLYNLVDRGNKFVIRAGYAKDDLQQRWGLVDIYDPINKDLHLIGCYEWHGSYESAEDEQVNLQMQAKGIYQAIKYIPITAISPGSFEVCVDGYSMNLWDESYTADEDLNEETRTIRLHLLAAFEQYGVELEELSKDELEDMGYEHDTIYNSGKHGNDEASLNSNMSKDRLN